jgi:hypothetical protein
VEDPGSVSPQKGRTPWSFTRVRRAVHIDQMSQREASRTFGMLRETVRKMLRFALPPGYRRKAAIRRLKLEAFTGVID